MVPGPVFYQQWEKQKIFNMQSQEKVKQNNGGATFHTTVLGYTGENITYIVTPSQDLINTHGFKYTYHDTHTPIFHTT
jgi:hypothetical protein